MGRRSRVTAARRSTMRRRPMAGIAMFHTAMAGCTMVKAATRGGGTMIEPAMRGRAVVEATATGSAVIESAAARDAVVKAAAPDSAMEAHARMRVESADEADRPGMMPDPTGENRVVEADP